MYGDHRDLHVLTHSFPTRRSSDLHERNTTMNNSTTPRTDPSPTVDTSARARAVPATACGSSPAISNSACGNRSARSRRRSAMAGTTLSWMSKENGEPRSEEHTSELQSLMRNPYAVSCLKKK